MFTLSSFLSMDLNRLHSNLINLDVWDILVRIIEKNLHHIERLNREQLLQGIRSTGGSTPRHSLTKKSRFYVESKIDAGIYDESIYPAMNFYMSGDFYKGITAKIDLMEGVYVESTDWKAEGLEEAYGSTLYGLTQNSLSEFIDIIIDEFRQNIKNAILK